MSNVNPQAVEDQSINNQSNNGKTVQYFPNNSSQNQNTSYQSTSSNPRQNHNSQQNSSAQQNYNSQQNSSAQQNYNSQQNNKPQKPSNKVPRRRKSGATILLALVMIFAGISHITGEFMPWIFNWFDSGLVFAGLAIFIGIALLVRK